MTAVTGVLPVLRSLGPVALLACLKGLHESGRLTPEILASLMLQFLPIFAQRVQRKVEKMNRKGLKMRQDKNFKPLMHFIKRLCIHFQEIPETRNVRDDLQNYLAGSEAARLGDTLAELLRCLVACSSRSTLASALLAVAKDRLGSGSYTTYTSGKSPGCRLKKGSFHFHCCFMMFYEYLQYELYCTYCASIVHNTSNIYCWYNPCHPNSCSTMVLLRSGRSPSLEDILRVVLPCVFPESFQDTRPCSEWAAILLGAPVHGGIACALCRQQNIVGPRFEGQQHGEGGEGRSLCGHCFVKETVKGKADDSSDLPAGVAEVSDLP